MLYISISNLDAGLSASRRAWEWVPLHRCFKTSINPNLTIMKKTIICLMALAGIALADTATFTSTSSNTNLGGFGGFDFSIAESSWLTSSTMNYEEYNAATLDSITLSMYNTWYTNNNMTTGFGIGIYEKATVGDAPTWTLVGKTDWFTHTSNSYTGTHTFAVEGTVTLNTESTYTAAFFAGSEYFAGLEIGSTRDSMTGANEWKNGSPASTTDTLAAVGLRGVTSDGTGSVLMYQPSTSGTKTGWTPNVTLATTPVFIPEPTTATLSLLALAGLAARRRRK